MYYKRHIQKQAQNMNKEAQSLLDAYNAYQNLMSEIKHALHVMHSFGHEIIKAVCEAVIEMNDFELQSMKMWTVCSISGNLCAECLCIDLKTSPQFTVTVDMKYRQFLEALWILFHVEKLQTSRIIDFERETQVQDCKRACHGHDRS